jgi:DNA-binding PucR family transcriptional regulator
VWSTVRIVDHRRSGVTGRTHRKSGSYCAHDHQPADIARVTHERLGRLSDEAVVGVGTIHAGVAGLRRGLFEALSSMGKGPGVHDASALSLAATVRLDRSGRSIAEAILAPLVDQDRSTASDLTDTLVAYLRNDCRPAQTADELDLHRNGLAYRLARIEALTGRDLASLEDRVELLLAARATGRL